MQREWAAGTSVFLLILFGTGHAVVANRTSTIRFKNGRTVTGRVERVSGRILEIQTSKRTLFIDARTLADGEAARLGLAANLPDNSTTRSAIPHSHAPGPIVLPEVALPRLSVERPPAETAGISELMEQLDSGDSKARILAMVQLGTAKAVEALPALIDVVRTEEDRRLRATAISAIGRIGRPESIPLLVALLADRELATSAHAALLRAKWRPSNDEEQAWVRFAARDWRRLSRLGDAAVEPFRRVLSGQNQDDRLRALNVLVQTAFPSLSGDLDAIIGDTNADPMLRHTAVKALAATRTPEAAARLRDLLQDDCPEVRIGAGYGLCENDLPGGREAVSNLAYDPNAKVREWARHKLAEMKMGSGHVQPGIDTLVSALRLDDRGTRWDAIRKLGKSGNPEAVPALVRVLHEDTDSDMRRRAARALGELGGSDALEALRAVVDDSDILVRRTAVSALAANGGPETADFIAECMRNMGKADQFEAAKALARMGQVAVPALIPLLQSPNPDVRENAAFGLGLIADPRATEALTAALEDDADMVRREAEIALGKIDGPQAKRVLDRLEKNRQFRSYMESRAGWQLLLGILTVTTLAAWIRAAVRYKDSLTWIRAFMVVVASTAMGIAVLVLGAILVQLGPVEWPAVGLKLVVFAIAFSPVAFLLMAVAARTPLRAGLFLDRTEIFDAGQATAGDLKTRFLADGVFFALLALPTWEYWKEADLLLLTIPGIAFTFLAVFALRNAWRARQIQKNETAGHRRFRIRIRIRSIAGLLFCFFGTGGYIAGLDMIVADIPTWGTPSGGFGLLFGLMFMIPGLMALTMGWAIWRPWRRPDLEK